MLLPRLLTAILGIPLLLFLIHWGGLSFSLFAVAISILCLYEYSLILYLGQQAPQRWLVVLGGGVMALVQVTGGPLGPVLAAMVALIVLRELFSQEHRLERMALTLFGVLLLGWMPAHLALIRDLRPHGEMLTFMFFISIWVCDTSAYFTGRMIGRNKLAPLVSPKKTWEGFVGGFIAATAVVFGFRVAEPSLMTAPQAIGVAGLIGVGSQLSDLAESMIKRSVGAKDSGALLPGHGGVMDRFDSFILAAPAVYYFLAGAR